MSLAAPTRARAKTAPRPLATRLAEARQGGPKIVRLYRSQRPQSLLEAYRVGAVIAGLYGPAAGYKIGATSPAGQAALGLSAPFFGVAPASRLVRDGDVAPFVQGPAMVDAEFVFEIARPIAPGDDPEDGVGAVRLGLEINAPSYAAPFAQGGLAIIADNGAHAGLVTGPRLPEGLDLADARLSLDVNGEERASGLGAGVLGSPWLALRWLVGALAEQGRALKPGDLVASGAVCAAEVAPGDRVAASLDGRWNVSVGIGADIVGSDAQ